MSIFFTAQFDKFFALMKTAFPDYERYANMPNEPENADDRFIFPGRETREDLLEEEKMKYNLAQQIKKLQEINTLWKNESSWENDPAGFVRSMKELHQEANRFQKAYSKGLKTVGDSSDRIFLQKCIADTTHTNTWLVTQMEKTIKQPNQNFLINRDSLAEVKNASQAALNRRIKAKMRNKDTHQFFSAIYDKMAESSRKVMWNSSEYRVMLLNLQIFNESREEDINTNVVSLITATEDYIRQKKDIPLTENGKTRLWLAHTLLDLAKVVHEGAIAERRENSPENVNKHIKELQQKLLSDFSPQLLLPNPSDKKGEPKKINLHEKKQPQKEKDVSLYLGKISTERLLSLGDDKAFVSDMDKLANLQARKRKGKALKSNPDRMHLYLKELVDTCDNAQTLEKKYVELITSADKLYDDYTKFCRKQLPPQNKNDMKNPREEKSSFSSKNQGGKGISNK